VLRVSDDAVIRLEGVHKWYGQYHALKNINITVLKGERIVICDPSGSGKSTLIRGISRLEEHEQGYILADGLVLDVLVEVAHSGMTILCMSHETDSARTVADRMVFMDEGEIIEESAPQEFFDDPRSARTRLFLGQILRH